MKTNRSIIPIIVTQSTVGRGGGIVSTLLLFEWLRKNGINAWLITGSGIEDKDKNILVLSRYHKINIWEKIFLNFANYFGKFKDNFLMQKIYYYLLAIANPKRAYYSYMGYDYFDFPETYLIPEIVKDDGIKIIHIGNTPGSGWFDLRALSYFSNRMPLILHLRDNWMYTGHCSLRPPDCTKFKSGCYKCPYLNITYQIRRDGSHRNLMVKKRIYKKSNIYLITVSSALMKEVEESVLAPAVKKAIVCPNGYDPQIFYPNNKYISRKKLGLQENSVVIGYFAAGLTRRFIKNYKGFLEAIKTLANSYVGNENIDILLVGCEERKIENISDKVRIVHELFIKDHHILADYYNALDFYVHASLYEPFGRTILESMACGKPIVAIKTGGIPDFCVSINSSFKKDIANSVLVEDFSPHSLAQAIKFILEHPEIWDKLGQNSYLIASENFTLDKVHKKILNFYYECVDDFYASSK